MPNVRHRRLKSILFIAFFVAAAIFGALMLQKYLGKEEMPVTPVPPQSTGSVRVSLFFASPDGDGLIREGGEIDACGDDLAPCIKAVLEKLINGPMGDLAPVLPAGTIVRDVQVRGDAAYVDFGRELADGLPGGSSAEMTAVYSIVDTIAFNFPRIRRVKFLLDGRDVETLRGHLDLRSPLAPDFGLEKGGKAQSGPNQG